MERETGIEPATNSLEGCDSTIELLPPVAALSHTLSRRRHCDPRDSSITLNVCSMMYKSSAGAKFLM